MTQSRRRTTQGFGCNSTIRVNIQRMIVIHLHCGRTGVLCPVCSILKRIEDNVKWEVYGRPYAGAISEYIPLS